MRKGNEIPQRILKISAPTLCRTELTSIPPRHASSIADCHWSAEAFKGRCCSARTTSHFADHPLSEPCSAAKSPAGRELPAGENDRRANRQRADRGSRRRGRSCWQTRRRTQDVSPWIAMAGKGRRSGEGGASRGPLIGVHLSFASYATDGTANPRGVVNGRSGALLSRGRSSRRLLGSCKCQPGLRRKCARPPARTPRDRFATIWIVGANPAA